jgi:hypothetical protein
LDQYGTSACIFVDPNLLWDWSNRYWVGAEIQSGIGDKFEFATGNLVTLVLLYFIINLLPLKGASPRTKKRMDRTEEQ